MSVVIVIGGGHNGLTAAALLARRGRRVLLIEQGEEVGGVARGSAFATDFQTLGTLHDSSCVAPELLHTLGLGNQLPRVPAEHDAVFFPEVDGPGLVLHRDPALAVAELTQRAPKDVANYQRWRDFIGRARRFVGPLLEAAPPSLGRRGVGSLLELLRRGWSLRRLGARDMTELMRVIPMSAADWLTDAFDCELLRAGLVLPALHGAWFGPRSPGGAANLLFHECLAGPELVGGPASLVQSLALTCRSLGVEIRTNSSVRRVLVERGVVAGVELDAGERVDGATVVATCDPRQLLLELLEPRALPAETESSAREWRCRGVLAKVDLALDGPLEWAGRPGARFHAVRISETLDTAERAFDHLKYGEFSAQPVLDLRVPSVVDRTFAPAGREFVSVLVSFAPHDVAGGWTAARREALADAVVARIAALAPTVSSRIVARQVRTPDDFARDFRLTGGHLYHGELALDQVLSLRPNVGCSSGVTPIPGLFLGGSGCHPGAGISGRSGMLAAERVLSAR
ncbi:MAG: phytoene desaturase family protein [Planctomycetota bacterium]